MRDVVQHVSGLLSPGLSMKVRSLRPVWQFVFVSLVLGAPESLGADQCWDMFVQRMAQARAQCSPVMQAGERESQRVNAVHLVSFGVPLALAYGMLDRAIASVNNRCMGISMSMGASFITAPEDALSDAVYHNLFGSAKGPCIGHGCETICHAVVHVFGQRLYPASGVGITVVVGSLRADEEPMSAEDISDARCMLDSNGTDAWLLLLLAPADSSSGRALEALLGAPHALDPWAAYQSPAPPWWAWTAASSTRVAPEFPATERQCGWLSQGSSQSGTSSAMRRWVLPNPSMLSSAADSMFLGEPASSSEARALLPLRESTAAGAKLLWRPARLVRCFGLHGWTPLQRAVTHFAACEGFIDDVSGMRVPADAPRASVCGEVRYCVQCENVYRALFEVPHGHMLADFLGAWLAALVRDR